MSSPWARLGAVPSDALLDARLQIHHAALLVAVVGEALLPPSMPGRDRLAWLSSRQALVGPTAPAGTAGSRPFAMALRPFDLMLMLLDGEGRAAGHLELDGRTREEAARWLGHALTEWTGLDLRERVPLPSGDLPEHPLADGAPFASRPAAPLQEAAAWLEVGQSVLGELGAEPDSEAAPSLDPRRLELGRGLRRGALEAGLSLGEDPVDEPHFRVRPRPAPPEGSTLPALTWGEWLVEDEPVAILPAGEICEVPDEAGRRARVKTFFDEILS